MRLGALGVVCESSRPLLFLAEVGSFEIAHPKWMFACLLVPTAVSAISATAVSWYNAEQKLCFSHFDINYSCCVPVS
jgi:hypothetical protein